MKNIFLKKTPHSISLYQDLERSILSLYSNIEIRPTPQYIGFWIDKKIFLYVHVLKNCLRLNLKKPIKEYQLEGFSIDLLHHVPKSHRWAANTRLYLKKSTEIASILPILELNIEYVKALD